jgi:protease IV
MSDWPPKPQDHNHNTSSPQAPKGQEWQLLEKVVLASVEEQRRARRWGIFFKFLTFGYILILFLVLGKGCSTTDTENLPTGKHLAVVDIEGTIAADKQSVNSGNTIRALKRAFSNKDSTAIVMRINSPGGSPVQADEIYQELKYLKQQHRNKKVYAVIGDTGASAAYYIASAADEILVNPSSLVGSIGVIMPNYGLEQAMKKMGVEDRTMTSGDNKALLSMTQPMDPAQKQHVQAMLDNVHLHFINAVKEGRGKKLKSQDPAIFSGLFWTGSQAITLGIADRIGNLHSLKRELETEKAYDYTVRHHPLETMLGRVGASVGEGFATSITKQIETESSASLR